MLWGTIMDQPLDLRIVFTSPPQGSVSGVIASIALFCDALGSAHTGDLLTTPVTDEERAELHWYLEEYWKWPYEQFLKRGRQVEDLLADIGERLYAAVFGSEQANSVVQTWRSQPAREYQISIVSDMPHILSLPWELLYDDQGFIALNTQHPTSIVRRLPAEGMTASLASFAPPLRILLVTARPEGVGFVDPRSIARELVDEVQGQTNIGAVALEILRPPTLLALQTRLHDPNRPPIHLVHFDGTWRGGEGRARCPDI